MRIQSKISRERIFVTGAGGFIGSHLVEALVRRGHEVVALVHYNSQGLTGWLGEIDEEIKGNFQIVHGDVRDRDQVITVSKGCDAIVHAAALIGIPYSYSSVDSYMDTNVSGTLNLLTAAKKNDVRKLVQISSSEVYGVAECFPISENNLTSARSPYAASKIAADSFGKAFSASFELPVVIVRPFNTFGPRQSTRAVIPTIITQLLFGSHSLKLGNTSSARDFTFVTDTVSGIVAACESAASDGEIFNLGTGFEIEVRDLVQEIGKILNITPSFHTSEELLRPKNSEISRLLSDNTKASETLGWEPLFAGLDGLRDGLTKTVQWFLEPKNLERYRAKSTRE